MPPILVKYRKIVSLTLANNAIMFTESAITGHRVQIQMSVDDLNTFFIWQRASGTSRPIGHFLPDVSGVKFSDIVLDSLNKVYTDLDGNTDGLNFSSYIFDANVDARTRGCGGRVSSNDLVMAYILYKCYGASACPTANVIYNLEDAQAMLSSGAVSMSITASFEEDEAMATLGGTDLGGVDSMFRNVLASAPLRFFQANGTQIPGLFETNFVCPPSDPPAQGSWQFMENDILELRMTFAFQQPVAHEAIDAVGTQSVNTVIKAGDTFSIRLQILATDTSSGAAAKAAAAAVAAAAAAAASSTAQQQAAANAMAAAAHAQQAVNSAAAQEQADAAQLLLIMTEHAQQQITVNNDFTIYGAAEASLNAAIVSGSAYSFTQQTRANALAAAAALTTNQTILANLSTQLVLTKLMHDAAVSTLAGNQTVAAAALLTSATANSITAAAALAAAQAAAAAAVVPCRTSPVQDELAKYPQIILSNQLAFTNASNATLGAWSNALNAQANEETSLSQLTNAQQVMNMAIILGNMSGIQIMMANVNAYTAIEAKANANLLSTNIALVTSAAREYSAYTTLLANSNTAANLSNLIATDVYLTASSNLSTAVSNVSTLAASNTIVKQLLSTTQATAGGNSDPTLVSTLLSYTTLSLSTNSALTLANGSSSAAQVLLGAANSNLAVTTSNLSTVAAVTDAALSTFSTTMASMLDYEEYVLNNPSTIQSAQVINSAHLTYNTMLENQELAQNALTVASRLLDTAIANQETPQKIALLQAGVSAAQAKLASADAALSTASALYTSATVAATEDPNALAILNLAATNMTQNISTALNNQLANYLYSAIKTENSLTTVLNDASVAYTVAMGALNNAITAGKGISEIQVLNRAVDSAKAAYSKAAIAAAAAVAAVSTAQSGVTADPNTVSILDSAAMIGYSTTQGALANSLVQQVTALYQEGAAAAHSTFVAQINYSTSVCALVSAVAGGATLPQITALQKAVGDASYIYAKTSQASIQLGTALVNEEQVAAVNPLALGIMNATLVNADASAMTTSVTNNAETILVAEGATASTLVAMQLGQNTYDLAMAKLDSEISAGLGIAQIQAAQTALINAGASLANVTMAYNNSLSTLTQVQANFSTSTQVYSTLTQGAQPLPQAITGLFQGIAELVVSVSTQTSAIASQQVVNLASVAYDTQLYLISSIAAFSTISSITSADGSTMTAHPVSTTISTFQSDSLKLALAVGAVNAAQNRYSTATAAALNYTMPSYIYAAIAQYNQASPPPPSQPLLTSSSVTSSGFTLTWAPVGASSVSFTLNGMATTPASANLQSATFTGLAPATAYTVVVTTTNSVGSSSATITVTTLGTAPLQPVLTITTLNTDNFQVNWSFVDISGGSGSGGSGPTSYIYSLNGAAATPTVDYGIMSQFIVFTSLTPNTVYTLMVTAVNSYGSTASAPLVITTPVVPPTAMVLSSTDVSPYSLTVTWTGGNSGNVVTNYSYTLVNLTTPSEPNNTYSGIETSGYLHVKYFGLHPSTEYMVTVVAENSGGSVNSSINVTTAAQAINVTPTNLSAATSGNSVVLTWTPVAGVAQYLYVIDGNQVTPFADNGIGYSSASFTGLTPSTTYSFVVVGIDGAGNQYDSEHLLVTTTALAVNVTPTNVVATAVTATGLTLSWTGVIGVTSYTYFFNSVAKSPTNDNGMVAQNAVFTGLTPSTSYTIYIVGIDGAGNQYQSTPISVSTNNAPPPDLTPTGLTATAVTATAFVIRWTGSVPAPVSYEYVLNGVSVTPYADYGLTRQTAAFSELSLSTLYSVQVIAIDGSGNQFPATFQVLTSGVLPVFKGQWTAGISYSVADLVNQGGLYGCTVATSGPFSLSNWLAYPGFLGVGDPSQNYSLNNIVVNLVDNKLYVCIQDIPGGMQPDPSQLQQWSLFATAGSQPFPIFNLNAIPTSTGFSIYWYGGAEATSYVYELTDTSGNMIPSSSYTLVDNGLTASLNSVGEAVFTGIQGSYNVKLIATNAFGTSEITQSVTTLAPSALTLTTNVTAYTATVTWTDSGATSYTYTLTGGDLSGNMPPTTDDGLASKTIVYTGLIKSASYTVTVTATNAIGSTSATASFTTLPPPFQGKWVAGFNYAIDDMVLYENTIYSALTATNDQTFTPTNWSANPNTYMGIWSRNMSNPGELYVSPIDNSLYIAILQDGAGDPTYPGINPSYFTLIGSAGTCPFPPYQLGLLGIPTATELTISWSIVSPPNAYTFSLIDLSGNTYSPTSDTSATNTLTYNNLLPSTTYTFTIFSTSSGAASAPNTCQVTTGSLISPPPDATPTNLDASSVASTGIKLIWTGGNTATSYTYFFNGNQLTPDTDNGVSAQNAIFTGLLPSTTYTIYIVATAPSGTYPSSSFNVTTTALVVDLTPTNVDATSVTDTGLTLIWTGVTGTTSYTYFFNGISVAPTNDNGIVAQNAVFTGLTPSTSYTIYIVAIDGAGNQYPSSSFNVSTGSRVNN